MCPSVKSLFSSSASSKSSESVGLHDDEEKQAFTIDRNDNISLDCDESEHEDCALDNVVITVSTESNQEKVGQTNIA